MRSRRSVRMMGRAFPTPSPRHSVTSSLHHSSPAGFTAVEVAVVLVIAASILLIMTPGLIRWYQRQRFLQEVQQVLASLRRAQFSAISTGHWMLVPFYTDCPDGLQLRRWEAPLLNIFCVQRFRLPAGRCSPDAAQWSTLSSNPESVPPCLPNTPPGQMCEYVQDFWTVEPRFTVWADIPSEALGWGATTYVVVNPDGSVGYIPEGADVPPGACAEMANPIVMPLPGMAPEQQQMRFGWPLNGPQFWQAVCLSGRGRLSLTPVGLAPGDLQCP
jgi:type II secretory pathway pseudopilin PulG